jgi:hypothetical protein
VDILPALLLAAALGGCMTPPQAPAPAPVSERARQDRWAPLVVGTDEHGRPLKPPASRNPAAPAPAVPAVEIDEQARAVRIPARLTRTQGVVECLLAAASKRRETAVLVTDCPVRDVAAALAKIGLAPGARPEAVGDDRARPPQGPPLRIEIVFKDTAGAPSTGLGRAGSPAAQAAGPETRLPAARLLSRQSARQPLAEGAWLYVGPQIVRDGDVEIHLTELSGNLISTNLRDTSALAYWVPKATGDPAPYVAAYYASSAPLPPADTCWVEIRPGAQGRLVSRVPCLAASPVQPRASVSHKPRSAASLG